MKNVEELLARAAELARDGRHFQAERAYKGAIRLLAKTEPTSERLAEACLQLERVYNELAGKIESRRNDYLDAANALGMHPNSLLRLIRNLDLRSDLESGFPRAATG